MRTCAIIHPLHLELETATYKFLHGANVVPGMTPEPTYNFQKKAKVEHRRTTHVRYRTTVRAIRVPASTSGPTLSDSRSEIVQPEGTTGIHGTRPAPRPPLRVPGVGDLTCGNYTSYTRMFRIGFEKESTHKPFFASRASVSNPSSTVSPGAYFRYRQHQLCLILRVLFGSPCRANPGTGVRLFCFPERPQSTRSCLAGLSGRYLES